MNPSPVPPPPTGSDGANRWYYAEAGKSHGPFSLGQIRTLVESGVLSPGTLVLESGTLEWKQASEVLGNFGSEKLSEEQEGAPFETGSASNVSMLSGLAGAFSGSWWREQLATDEKLSRLALFASGAQLFFFWMLVGNQWPRFLGLGDSHPLAIGLYLACFLAMYCSYRLRHSAEGVQLLLACCAATIGLVVFAMLIVFSNEAGMLYIFTAGSSWALLYLVRVQHLRQDIYVPTDQSLSAIYVPLVENAASEQRDENDELPAKHREGHWLIRFVATDKKVSVAAVMLSILQWLVVWTIASVDATLFQLLSQDPEAGLLALAMYVACGCTAYGSYLLRDNSNKGRRLVALGSAPIFLFSAIMMVVDGGDVAVYRNGAWVFVNYTGAYLVGALASASLLLLAYVQRRRTETLNFLRVLLKLPNR